MIIYYVCINWRYWFTKPAYACGTGTISLGDPCIQLGLISSSSDSEDACPIINGNLNCWISGTGEPNSRRCCIYRCLDQDTVFPGDGNYYHLFTIQSSTLTFSAQVDSNGVIQGLIAISVLNNKN